MSNFKWLLAGALTAATVIAPLVAAEPIAFTPENGFGGESVGAGSLKLLLGKPRAFHVTSNGSKLPDGTFRLDQTITFEGETPKVRFWILTAIGDSHYTATLSDAAGPVKGFTSGSHLSLHYRVKGPLVMHQELELSLDGRTIDNVGVITLLGIPVGHMHETITRKVPSITSNYSFKPRPLHGSA
ncbi:MAG: DUF3833 family protein [Pseudoxanthomonas sp.]